MSSQQPDLDALIAALQSDLPSERERARMRTRLLSAGIAVTAVSAASDAAASGTALAGGAAQGASASVGAAASVGAKLAGLSLAAKVGWSAAVIASASALALLPLQQESAAGRHVRPSAPTGSDIAPALRGGPMSVTAPAAAAAAPALTAAAAQEPAAVAAHEPTAIAATHPIAHRALAAAVAPPPSELPATAATARAMPTARPRADGVDIAAPSARPRRALPRRAPSSPERTAAAPSPGSVDAVSAARASPAPDASEEPAPRVTVLREEAELLERALTALHDGDRAGADRWLAAHAERFPNGALRRERERARRHLERLATTAQEPVNGGREHD